MLVLILPFETKNVIKKVENAKKKVQNIRTRYCGLGRLMLDRTHEELKTEGGAPKCTQRLILTITQRSRHDGFERSCLNMVPGLDIVRQNTQTPDWLKVDMHVLADGKGVVIARGKKDILRELGKRSTKPDAWIGEMATLS